MKIGIFYDREMPYDGIRPDQKVIEALSQYAQIIHLNNYKEKLEGNYDTFINLHGQYFIKDAWTAIKEHLKASKGLINIGDGAPFSKPMSHRGGQWVVEREQTAYHEELSIYQAPLIDKERISFLKVNEHLPLLKGYEDCFTPKDTVGFVVNFAKGKDIENEVGSCGPIDAVLYPLLDGYLNEARKTAAPVVMIEHTKGHYEGGRWVFINQKTDNNFWQTKGVELIKTLAHYVADQGYEVEVRTNYASFYPGEQPTLLLQFQSYRKHEEEVSVNIDIYKEDEKVYEKRLKVHLTQVFQLMSMPTDLKVEKGLYTIQTRICLGDTIDRVLHSGFWGFDQELLESGNRITCDKDYFYKDGQPMPVVGMTYMQPDVHRKFIHRPNVYLWDQDFNTMKRAGINMLRTGIWTSFKSIMPSDGFVSEEVLRVFDAMFLTAKKYDLPIVFNFFAFAPEMWRGINPYLDPRSIQAQKRYMNAVVTRHKNSQGVMWDLINEPSVSNPNKLWQTRPKGDIYELNAWQQWLKVKHGTIGNLLEKWNYSCESMADFDAIDLPKEEDFSEDTTNLRHGLKVHDYYLFTQEVFNKWAQEMYEGIRDAQAQQLITVGQDEGTAGRRPHPLFNQEVIDYTCNHPWWQLDDLFWDSIFCKSPNKPNLSQETGIMNVNYPNGKGKLTEAYTRDLLERKYAYAFAADNAGAIQWVWNINTHIDSLNESTIGPIRPDGGQKLEADVSYDFGAFMGDIAPIFRERKEGDIVVIHPFANNFSVGDHSVISTKKLSHILGHTMGVRFKVYGEYQLDLLRAEKLILLPSPRTITNEAFSKILECVEKGSVLYISGPFSYDEYWGKVDDRAERLDLQTELKSVCREEVAMINDEQYRTTFGNLKRNWVDKEVEVTRGGNDLKVLDYGRGKVIWSPLPLEMNDQDEVIQKAYEYAITIANIQLDFTWLIDDHNGILGKKLKFKEQSLYIFISELAEDKDLTIKDHEHDLGYKFLLPAQRIMMFATDSKGIVMKTYKGWQVESAML